MDIKHLEKVFKGLGNRRRISIIKLLLGEKELPVGEVAKKIKLSFTSTSKHLGMLRQLDILDSRQQDLTVYYRISSDTPQVVRRLFTDISNSRE